MRGEHEQLASAYASALRFYDQLRNPHSIAFISMGTGVYKWPLGLAAEIAVNELLKSPFDKTTMCVLDEATRAVYLKALGDHGSI